MKYRCRDCGSFFTEEEADWQIEYHHEVSEYGHTPYEEIIVCPCCGSMDIDDDKEF